MCKRKISFWKKAPIDGVEMPTDFFHQGIYFFPLTDGQSFFRTETHGMLIQNGCSNSSESLSVKA